MLTDAIPADPDTLNDVVVSEPPALLYPVEQVTAHVTVLLLTDAVAVDTPAPLLHDAVDQLALIVLPLLQVTDDEVSQPVNTLLDFVILLAVPLALLHDGRVNVLPCVHVNVTLFVPVAVVPLTVNVPEPPFLLTVTG